MHQPLSRRRLGASLMLLTGLAMAALYGPPEARAADFGAKTSGNWTAASTWTPAGVPGLNDVAFIGSTSPGGSAATATVLLTQNQQANTVVLGNGAGTSGTLNLGNFNLTANALYLGVNGGTGAVTRGTGSFNLVGLAASRSTLVMNGNDRVEDLILRDGSDVTTSSTGNISSAVRVWSGSTLTLGADLISGGLFNDYNIEVSGANSTLDARGYKITAPVLSIGWEYVQSTQVPGSHAVRFLNRGDLDVNSLFVANQALNLTDTDRVRDYYRLANGSTTFAPGASVYGLILYDGSTATTTSVGNITGLTIVQSGSTLTLGADLDVTTIHSGGVNVSGNNSTLDAQGHKITAFQLHLGWTGGANVRLLNRGGLQVEHLNVANQNFHLTAIDRVTNFTLSNGSTTFVPTATVQSLFLQDGATAATSAVGNITTGVEVLSGSTLTLGADLRVPGYVVVHGDSSTLNAQGHNITADHLTLARDAGTNSQLLNRGNLAVNSLYVVNQNLNLTAADQVTAFGLFGGSSNLGATAGIQTLHLENSSAITAATGNLTGSVNLLSSTLTLGADLSVSGLVDVVGNSTLNAQGRKITADTLSLGGPGARLLNRGDLAVTNLNLGDQTLSLGPADRVANLRMLFAAPDTGSNVSTAVTGNVTGSVEMSAGSTLTLGADLAVTGDVTVGGFNSTLDARGHDITANSLSIQYFSATPGTPDVRLLNDGAVTLSEKLLLRSVHVELHDGNDSAQRLDVSGGPGLRIKSAATGFTITGTENYNLYLSYTTLTLELDGLQPGWVLRWANPAGGDHLADLNALIDQDLIVFDVTNGGEYALVSRDGYTYIVQPVPEPGLILLLAAPVAVGLCLRRRGPRMGTS